MDYKMSFFCYAILFDLALSSVPSQTIDHQFRTNKKKKNAFFTEMSKVKHLLMEIIIRIKVFFEEV